jgi:hypothetical protein
MSQVNPTNIRTITNSIDLGPSGSLQFEFAKLQMALSQAAKENAMGYIDQIKSSQDEQKQASAFLNAARSLQSQATESTTTDMSAAMYDYMKANNLAGTKEVSVALGGPPQVNENGEVITSPNATGTGYPLNKDEWAVAITSLQSHLDRLGSNTQQLMVFVQDFMGQYNSYLQGSNSAIQQSNQTLSELARTR